MKNLVLAMFLSLPLFAVSQTYSVPNGSFEHWPPPPASPAGWHPNGWTGLYGSSSAQVVPPISRSFDAADSTYSLVIQPARNTYGETGVRYYDTSTNPNVPRRLTGRFKLQKDGSFQNARIYVCFTSTQQNTSCTKGVGVFDPYPATVWTPFSIDIRPDTTAPPQFSMKTVAITIRMIATDTSAYPVSKLHIDGLRFEYDTATNVSPALLPPTKTISAFPNPVADGVLHFSKQASGHLCDLSGRVVMAFEKNGKRFQ